MKQHLLAALLLGQTALLSACGSTFDFNALRQKDFGQSGHGNQFSTALGQAYKNIALYEVDEMGDWIDAAQFSKKARRSAAGRSVTPEKPADWWLSEEQAEIMKAARERLMAALDDQSTARLPQLAAKAQVGFDCWIEQLEENWQKDHIAKCRNQFVAAIEQLEDMAAIASSAYPIIAPEIRSLPVIKANVMISEPQETNRFTLYFSFGAADIDAASKTALKQVVKAYRSGAPVTISLAGHTDRAGPQPYNFKLSRRRAEAVRRALIENGVPVQMIAAQAFGESRPRRSTPDGVRAPQNRRVEITVGRASSL